MERLIQFYFHRGHKYKLIPLYLLRHHGVRTSKRTVERVLQRHGLRRNRISPDINDPALRANIDRIQLETDQRAGYIRTWGILNRRYRVRATQEVVRRYLRISNPSAVRNRLHGVLQRRRYFCRSPNHIWHCDGYDKLKPFGFAIHGAIDGFSRKILWISCSTTNNDPAVILHYYLATVTAQNGTPLILRTDHGSETGLAAAAQCTLGNSRRAHIYGPSYRNQRIECWWSCLRKSWTQIWMNLFDNLVSFGIYNPADIVHRAVAEFCFLHVLQHELSTFKDDWNSHRIRATSTSGCPGGIANELFELPELYGFQNVLSHVAISDIRELCLEAQSPPITTCPEVRNLCVLSFAA